MDNRDQSLTYLVVPGSGTGDFAGVTGRLELDIHDERTTTSWCWTSRRSE